MWSGVRDAYDMAMESLKVFSCYLENGERDEEQCQRLRQSLQRIVQDMDAEKAFFIHLLDKTIAETERLYRYAVTVLQRASEINDDEMAHMASHFVSAVYNDHFIRRQK